MNDQNLHRDLGDLIDGIATPEQVARLRRAFSEDPAAAELYKEMRELDQLLRKAPRELPPDDLKDEVLRAIRAQRRAAPGREGWFQTLRGAFARKPGLGLAYSFSAGLVLGALVLWLIPGPVPRIGHPGQVSGTMIRDKQEDTGHLTISYTGGTIVVNASPSTEGHDLRLSVEGPGAVDVTLRGVSSPDSVVRLEVKAAGEVRQHDIHLAPGGH